MFHDRGPYHIETRSLICYWFLCDRDLHHERVNMSLFSTHFNLVVLIKLVLIKRVYMDDYGALNETSQSNFSHCVKCDQIRSFFWSIFSRIRTKYGEILRQNTDWKKLRIWALFTQSMSIKFCALEMFNSAVFIIFDFRLANINFAIFQIVSLIWFLKFYLHLANEVNHLQKFLLFIKQIN